MMSQEATTPFWKQVLAGIVTVSFGSFIFVGITENYKSDESIKLRQLEDYFKPARESAIACLSKQNELFLHYPMEAEALRLMFSEVQRLIEKPDLRVSFEYGLVLQGYAENLVSVQKINKELPKEVGACQAATFQRLEALAIATGNFEGFTDASDRRSIALNEIDRRLRERLKIELEGLSEDDLLRMVRRLTEADFSSPENISEIVAEFGALLPALKSYGLAMAEAEQEKHQIELQFFSEIRRMSAQHINSRFEQGFFGWLFR